MIYREVFGYKKAYGLIACILLVVGAIIVCFFRNEPEKQKESKEQIRRQKSEKEPVRGWNGISYAEAVRKTYFYGIIACIFFSGLCLEGVYGIAAAHMTDVGLNSAYVVRILSINALTMAAFKFLTGIIYDKFGLRITMSTCCIAAVAAMLALSGVTDSEMGKVLALMYGILSSLAFPMESVLLPICTGDLFGLKSFDQILGILAAVNVAGYAVGAPIMNICFDVCGNYQPVLIASGVVMLAVMIGLQFVLCAAKRQQNLRTKNCK